MVKFEDVLALKPGEDAMLVAGVSRLRPELYWAVDCDLRLASVAGGNSKLFWDLSRWHEGATLYEILGTVDPTSIVIDAHVRALAGELVAFEYPSNGRLYRSSVWPIYDDGGTIIGATGNSVEATEEIKLRRTLHRTEEALELAQEAAHLGTWTLEGHDARISWSSELYRLCGLERNVCEPSMDLLISHIHPDDRLALEVAFDIAFEERGSFALDTRLCRQDGPSRWVQHRGFVTVGPSGTLRAVGTVLDIEARKAAEARLLHRSHYDDLTGLPNRKLLMDRLQQALLGAQHSQSPVAVLYVDLDRYKTISDTLGVAIGDRLLAAVVPRLAAAAGVGETIARCGNDEFAILLADIASVDEAARIAERVVAAFAVPFDIDDLEIYATASVGIALSPEDGTTPEDLLRGATSAQQRACATGSGTFRFYGQATHATAIERLEFERRLRRAVENDAMTVHYQPIVDRFDRPVAVEALVRWNDDRFGNIPPDRFIALCEELGLIGRLGRWIASEALAQLARWDAAGLPLLRLALNISGRQLNDPTFAPEMAHALERAGVAAERVELEITESVIIEDVRAARRAVGELKALGLRISLDDFGTGYSSLTYLKHFRVDALKVDRTFVMDLPGDRGDAAIVSAVVALGHAMGLTIVAEGVETAEQAAVVREIGCDELQGYHYSKALPPEDFERVVRALGGSARTR